MQHLHSSEEDNTHLVSLTTNYNFAKSLNIFIFTDKMQNHNRQNETKWKLSHHIPYARLALGGLQLPFLQGSQSTLDLDDLWVSKQHQTEILLQSEFQQKLMLIILNWWHVFITHDRASIQCLQEDDLEELSIEPWHWEKTLTLLQDMDLWRKERLHWHPQRWWRSTAKFLPNHQLIIFQNIIKIQDIFQPQLYGLCPIAMILMEGILFYMVINFLILSALSIL